MNPKMKNKFSMTLFVCAALLALTAVAFGQQTQQAAKPVAFVISKNLAIGKLSQGGTDVYDVRGKLNFTVTAANSDDTVTGTVSYTIPDDARQKIADRRAGKAAQVRLGRTGRLWTPAESIRFARVMDAIRSPEPPPEGKT